MSTDTGLKLVKQDADITSTDPDDYMVWTKYPPLSFLEKKTVTIIVTTSCDLSDPVIEEVPYDWDFIPVVLGKVRKTAGFPTGDVDNAYSMPAEDFAAIDCDFFTQDVRFNFKVVEDQVEIEYVVNCIEPMVGAGCPLGTQTFVVDLYFYMWELGSVWPIP